MSRRKPQFGEAQLAATADAVTIFCNALESVVAAMPPSDKFFKAAQVQFRETSDHEIGLGSRAKLGSGET